MMMMKKLLAVFALIVLAGCDPYSQDVSTRYSVKPAELKDCSFNELGGGGGRITVVRCLNSTTTTTMHEKSLKTIVVIDGVEFEKVEK